LDMLIHLDCGVLRLTLLSLNNIESVFMVVT